MLPYVQEASLPEAWCLKPWPFAYCWQTKSLSLRPKLIDWQTFCLSVYAKGQGKSSSWQTFCLSINDFGIFSVFFFVFLESLIDKKSVSKRKPQTIFFDPWQTFCLSVHGKMCHWQTKSLSMKLKVCHWQTFCLSMTKSVPLTDKRSVNEAKSVPLTDFLSVSDHKCATDRQKVCQTKTLVQWQTFCLSVAHFWSHWQTKSLSAIAKWCHWQTKSLSVINVSKYIIQKRLFRRENINNHRPRIFLSLMQDAHKDSAANRETSFPLG